jgi:hypothetical protein
MVGKTESSKVSFGSVVDSDCGRHMGTDKPVNNGNMIDVGLYASHKLLKEPRLIEPIAGGGQRLCVNLIE